MASIPAAANCLQQRWIRFVDAGRRVADGGLGWSAKRRPATARAKGRKGALMQVWREGMLCRRMAVTV